MGLNKRSEDANYFWTHYRDYFVSLNAAQVAKSHPKKGDVKYFYPFAEACRGMYLTQSMDVCVILLVCEYVYVRKMVTIGYFLNNVTSVLLR